MRTFDVLDNPFVWELSRVFFDIVCGFSRKRIDVMKRWGLLKDNPSVIDIGCGIGQYASITDGAYCGIDMNERYIRHAGRKHKRTNREFRCQDVTTLLEEDAQFDLVLMVDFLHHIPDGPSVNLLNTAARLARGYVVSFEPITEQRNRMGAWLVENDRGNFVRPLEGLHRLFHDSDLTVIESFNIQLGTTGTQAILARAA